MRKGCRGKPDQNLMSQSTRKLHRSTLIRSIWYHCLISICHLEVLIYCLRLAVKQERKCKEMKINSLFEDTHFVGQWHTNLSESQDSAMSMP